MVHKADEWSKHVSWSSVEWTIASSLKPTTQNNLESGSLLLFIMIKLYSFDYNLHSETTLRSPHP